MFSLLLFLILFVELPDRHFPHFPDHDENGLYPKFVGWDLLGLYPINGRYRD
jgi:hypothetical protein